MYAASSSARLTFDGRRSLPSLAFRTAAVQLTLSLDGDEWSPEVGSPGAASAALLGALRSQQPSERYGWGALIAPRLNHTHLAHISSTTISLTVPRTACYRLLGSAEEVIALSVPASTVASGRAPHEALPLRVSAGDAAVRAPRWGHSRQPPIEKTRNCTHATLEWFPPSDLGSPPVDHYRIETRMLAEGEDEHGPFPTHHWTSTPPITTTTTTIGPYAAGERVAVRVRAYSAYSAANSAANAEGCAPVAGDEGATLVLHAGLRAHTLTVESGVAGGGGGGGGDGGGGSPPLDQWREGRS